MKKMSFSRKYIAKTFSLKKFLVSKCIFKLVCFCKSCRESGICFEHIGIGMAYLYVFLIRMHKIDTASEVHLELFQTYMRK